MKKLKIHCCGCNDTVQPRKTNGSEVYPHRPDLADKTFWKCDDCGNYVGAHGSNKAPLGCIPTEGIRHARKVIHQIIDPLWKEKLITRDRIYTRISECLGYRYHSGNIKTLDEAAKVRRIVKQIEADLRGEWSKL